MSADLKDLMRAAAVLIPFLLAGCDPGARPQPGPVFSEIRRDSVDLRTAYAASFGPALNRAAFNRLQGLTRAQVITLLQADGFTCDGTICRFENVERISQFEVTVGITTIGEPHSIVRSWNVTIVGDPIQSEQDLQITTTSRIVPDA